MPRLFPLLLLLLLMPPLRAVDPLEAYPEAEDGMVRHILKLPIEKDQSKLKLELAFGKTIVNDDANTYFFGGKVVSKSVEGWGDPYYVLPKLGPLAGTLMAVPPDAPKIEHFVPVGGEPFLISYTSKIPVVIYTPGGVELRYHLWRGEAEAKPVGEG